MQALVYAGNGVRSWTEVPDPQIVNDTDAIVQIDTATICGTDLHILGGDVTEVAASRVLGHEAVGTVVETGASVRNIEPGQRVLISCISSCGMCQPCRSGRYGQCLGGGGWLLGHTIDGVQAEYARIPFADFSCYRVPDALTNDEAVYLADVLPTGYEVGVLNGKVRPGATVAIVGSGAIGLSAVMGAQLFSAGTIVAIDPNASRLHLAKQFGADILAAPGEAVAALESLSADGKADVVIEAVGTPAAFELCTMLVRPGGRVANVGVHGKPVTLHMESLWASDVTITTGLVDTNSIPTLMALAANQRIDPTLFTTHRFAFGQAMAAYDVFADADRYEALKVIMHRDAPAVTT